MCAGCSPSCRHSLETNAAQWLCWPAAHCAPVLTGLFAASWPDIRHALCAVLMIRMNVRAAAYPADTVRRRMQLKGSVGQQQICTRATWTVCRPQHKVKACGPFHGQCALSTDVCAGCSISCRHGEEKNAAQRLCRSAADCLQGLPGLCAIHGAD